jgi:hypothetical protein
MLSITGAEIFLPYSFKDLYNLSGKKKINFKFGSWNKPLKVKFKRTLSKGTIGLSSKLKKEIFIPEDVTFQLNVINNTVQLGPMILWVAANENKRLIERLPNLQKRVERHVPETGMICICSEEGVDPTTDQIEGFYYSHDSSGEELKWKKAVFSKPGAVFKRVRLSTVINTNLMKQSNGNMFNSYFHTKWEMWRLLSRDNAVSKHLPFTKKVNKISAINKVLRKYPSVYIKPVDGSEGAKIIRVEKSRYGYRITDDRNNKANVVNLEDYPKLQEKLNSYREYIVQQDVSMKHDSRNVDFRIYMQKNKLHKWTSSGITARVGRQGSIITNLRQQEYWIKGSKALRKIYGLSKKGTASQEKKIIDICTKACEAADKTGHFGDIAIDFTVDKNLNVWILEMNMRNVYPVEDRSLSHKVKGTPFLYAMSLDGFNVEEKREKKEKKEKKETKEKKGKKDKKPEK